MLFHGLTIASTAGLLVSSAAASVASLAVATTSSTGVLGLPGPETNGDEVVDGGCCAYLAKSSIGNRLLTPNVSGFADRAAMHWSLAARLTPSCIILPYNANEVSLAVKALVAGTTKQSCQFSIRSGGHTIWPGAADLQNGVMLDLGYLNQTTVNLSQGTASIGPGARWGNVYTTLLQNGVLTTGGRDPTVGVAGFATGGGNSFYAPRKGFATDNVVNFEVVLADGSIVNVNSKSKPDLFQALKGGSGNFGIVVSFEFATWAAEDLWGGVVTWSGAAQTQCINALVDFANNIPNDPYGSAIIFLSNNNLGNDTNIIGALDYTKPVVRPAIYNEFFAIPGNTSDSTRIADLADLTAELEQPAGFRDFWLTLTFKNEAAALEYAAAVHADLSKSLQGSATGNWTINTLFQPISPVIAQQGVKNGGNVMGLDRFTDTNIMYLLYFAWNDAKQDALFQNAGNKAISNITSWMVKNNYDNPFIYLNYADRSQKPLESYGPANLAKVKAAAAKYDPTGVFQKLSPGGFKISLV